MKMCGDYKTFSFEDTVYGSIAKCFLYCIYNENKNNILTLVSSLNIKNKINNFYKTIL